MKDIKSEKGITLVALIITIIILVILTGVSLFTYGDYSNSIRLQKFNTELDTIQIRVNEISNTNESYIDNVTNEKVYLKNLGETPNSSQLEGILQIIGLTEASINDFRFFTKENLEKQLDISAIEQDIFINFKDKIVVSADGLKIGEDTHYISTNQRYTVSHAATNETNIDFSLDKISNTSFYINIITNDSYYSIKYKEQGEEFWNSVIDNRFTGKEGKTYDISFTKLDGTITNKTIIILSGEIIKN